MSRAWILAACLLASAGLAGCNDTDPSADSDKSAPSSAPGSPSQTARLPPRRALAEAIDRIPATGRYCQKVMTASGTVTLSVVGEYEQSRRAARLNIRFLNEDFTNRTEHDVVLSLADGQVLGWEVQGQDVTHGLDGTGGVTRRVLAGVARSTFTVDFNGWSDEPIEPILVPAPDTVTSDRNRPCSAEGTAA